MSKIDVERELQKAQADLLPIERKLIAWSLGFGLVLLALLALFNRTIGA
jgi:hypothetical protein